MSATNGNFKKASCILPPFVAAISFFPDAVFPKADWKKPFERLGRAK